MAPAFGETDNDGNQNGRELVKKSYRINYFALAINILLVIHNAIPPFKWIHLLGVINLMAIGMLIYAIRMAKQTERRQEKRELERDFKRLQACWNEDWLDEEPLSTWFLADTRQP